MIENTINIAYARKFYKTKDYHSFCNLIKGNKGLFGNKTVNQKANISFVKSEGEKHTHIYLDYQETCKVAHPNFLQLINLLKKMEIEFLNKIEEERKIYYYSKREEFNFLKKELNKNEVKLAALMIFLNRTCFNGLYRVNKRGDFNVPMGNYKMPKICDEENLLNISIKLQNVNIVYGDYTKSYNFVDENTFVYFDPPYRPLNKTASFTSYTEFSFEDKEQKELSEYFELLNKKNVKLLLSNSDPKNENIDDDFFDELYKQFYIKRVSSQRVINSKGTNRGKITEILVSNIKIKE